MTQEELMAEIAAAHAQKFPKGCPMSCEECVTRLGIQFATCPYCKNPRVPVKNGALGSHDRRVRVGNPRWYRTQASLCGGSGGKVK
jgi:hypothetical protein